MARTKRNPNTEDQVEVVEVVEAVETPEAASYTHSLTVVANPDAFGGKQLISRITTIRNDGYEETLYSAFRNPQQALAKLSKLISNNTQYVSIYINNPTPEK